MDVRCNRCATEYDFDDALISERGTTVKCTNCGFQFKVFPPNAALVAPERWVVRTAAGVEHVFLSLRELQRGITEQKVGAKDLLSRGKQPPRPLGSIAELEQFFHAPATLERPKRTLLGVAPTSADPLAEEDAPPRPAPAPTARKGTDPYGTLPAVTSPEPAPEPERPNAGNAALSLPGSAQNYAGETLAIPTAAAPSVPRAASSPQITRGSQPELGPLGQIPDLRSNPRASSPISPPPSSRRDFRSYDDLAADSVPDPRRRVRSRWIAAVVAAGILTLFAFTVGRRFIVATRTPAIEPVPGGDAKFTALLKDGTRLLDEGQLDEAGEQLTRATALADKDPQVLAALARLSVLRADVSWLKLRLLDPKLDELSVQATQRELGRAVGKAQSAVNAAFAVAPENLVVLRARIDALRLSGDRETAREWLRPVATSPADPANAYVLAALDLADDTPDYAQAISRLETAASGERKPGRAHVALVYALARAGRLAEAEAALKKFDSDATSAPLIDELTTFLARERTSAPRTPEKSGKVAASAATPEAPPTGGQRLTPGAPASNAGATDFRKLLGLASQAFGRGEYGRAEELYEQVLAQRPGNTEALAGLADVARHRNDPVRAARLYDQVLADNPSYVPALLASADLKWSRGERASALALYKRVLEQTGPSTSYGRRAAARIAEAESAKESESGTRSAEGAPRESGGDSEGTERDAPPQSDAPSPDIDTTDLPEFK